MEHCSINQKQGFTKYMLEFVSRTTIKCALVKFANSVILARRKPFLKLEFIRRKVCHKLHRGHSQHNDMVFAMVKFNFCFIYKKQCLEEKYNDTSLLKHLFHNKTLRWYAFGMPVSSVSRETCHSFQKVRSIFTVQSYNGVVQEKKLIHVLELPSQSIALTLGENDQQD